jgi:periplasmic protein CpxP/Spy
MLSSEAKQAVVAELKRIGGELNLSDDQKTKLQTALENAREKIEDLRKANPDLTQADMIAKLRSVRDVARERLVQFLTPDQLTKWDAEIKKAKSFLGVNM